MSSIKILVASFCAVALAACANSIAAPSSGVTRIVSTTAFGMCVGYCTTRLEISAGQAVLIREARAGRGGGGPVRDTQRFTAQLTLGEWQEIQRLAAAADLDALPDVVGCPDCADGGAEGLTIEGPAGSESVSFEFGARLAPAQPLLDRVRAPRARLMPDER